MIRGWKNKMALAVVGVGVLMSAIFSGCRLAEEDVDAQITPPVPTPSATTVPSPAPKAILTATETIECTFGVADIGAGWDDAFNLRSYGFTTFPASLKLTTDPAACKALWLATYNNDYSQGTNDICNIIQDYIEVATPEELDFCGLESLPPPPPPTPSANNPTALCCDGWISYSQSRSGTCSWHGGVCEWY